MTTIADIRQVLTAYHPRLSAETTKTPAAVAAVLCVRSAQPHLLFIERSEHEGDPWSGHIAFPGGRIEECDPDPRSAAERETLEEIGIDLRPSEYLGRLDDLTGTTLPVLVSSFVYYLEGPTHFKLNSEVKEAFWVPLGHLLDPARHLERSFPFRGLERRILPAIDILGPGRPVLWGITYRFTARLLQLAGYQLPHPNEHF